MMSRAHKNPPLFLSVGWLLAGILASYVLFNILVFSVSEPLLPEWLQIVILGAWSIEPLLLSIWAAMGAGAFATRVSLVIPSLLLLIVAPGMRPDGFRHIAIYEFKAIAIVGLAMSAVTSVLLLALRWIFGWNIDFPGDTKRPRRLQFDIKHLIVLTTLCAVVLGVVVNPVFKPPEQSFLFGPDFVVGIIYLAGATVFFAHLPLVVVPLLVLSAKRSRRAVAWAFATWTLMTSAVCIVWLALDEQQTFIIVILLQSGAVLLSFPTAVVLKRAGYRLQGRPSTS